MALVVAAVGDGAAAVIVVATGAVAVAAVAEIAGSA